MKLYHCPGFRAVRAQHPSEAAGIFATRTARKSYGSVGRCGEVALLEDGDDLRVYACHLGTPNGELRAWVRYGKRGPGEVVWVKDLKQRSILLLAVTWA